MLLEISKVRWNSHYTHELFDTVLSEENNFDLT